MTVYFRPRGDLSVAPLPRSPEDAAFLENLSAATGIKIETYPDIDYEDWMEPACLLDAALRAGVEVAILPPLPLPEAMAAPIAHIAGSPCPDMFLGRQRTNDPFHLMQMNFAWPPSCNDLANRYAQLETFKGHAGRKLRLAAMPGDPEMAGEPEQYFGKPPGDLSLGRALLDFAGSTCIVKQVAPAKELALLRLSPQEGMTLEEAERLFIDKTGFHFANYEGDRDALLVQEIVPMRCETRFFVVDGAVVTGAACIEAHTPRQRAVEDGAVPDVFETHRNGGEIIRSAETAQSLLGFARKVAAEIAAETSDLPHYVLDVAMSDAGPLVIEMNPIAQSGLYAIDPERLFGAILEAVKRGPEPDMAL